MGEFSLTHWLIILIILVLFFGPSRLPQLGQSLGKALRGFKEGLSEKEKETQAEMKMSDPNARIDSIKMAEKERDVSHAQSSDPDKKS